MILRVGIAELKLSSSAEDTIMAPNLGSCLGIVAYDKNKKRGGIVHCLLPLSKGDEEKAKEKPFMYVDTGFAGLLAQLMNLGARREDLVIAVAGGANINDAGNVFEIGKKNFTVFRKLMWKNSLLISGQDVGGNDWRTVTLNIATGEIRVKTASKDEKLMQA